MPPPWGAPPGMGYPQGPSQNQVIYVNGPPPQHQQGMPHYVTYVNGVPQPPMQPMPYGPMPGYYGYPGPQPQPSSGGQPNLMYATMPSFPEPQSQYQQQGAPYNNGNGNSKPPDSPHVFGLPKLPDDRKQQSHKKHHSSKKKVSDPQPSESNGSGSGSGSQTRSSDEPPPPPPPWLEEVKRVPLHQRAMTKLGVAFREFPAPDKLPTAPTGSASYHLCEHALFIGQLHYECSLDMVVWIIDVISEGKAKPVHVHRRGAGCVMAYFDNAEESQLLRSKNGFALFDYTGIWVAKDEEQAEEMRNHVHSVRQIVKMAQLPRDSIVIRL